MASFSCARSRNDILRSCVLPADADRDAAHSALAMVTFELELPTHSNVFIQAKLRKLADAADFTLPVICTPEELLENDPND